MALSLYVHIPFCIRKCPYCDFLSLPFDEGLSRRYASALRAEASIKGGGRLRTIYVGGGTPTALPTDSLVEIIDALRGCFELEEGAEVTVEANPGTLDEEKAAMLVSSGVNRLSLGVQSFDDLELKTLGRLHSASDAERAIEACKEAGLKNLSLDLIYAIPGQTPEGWSASLARAVGHAPAHISAYELTPEEGTPLAGMLKEGELKMPPEELQAQMSETARDVLDGAGYARYEISNYAAPGLECAHNVNYWERGEYIGLGAGAHSFSGGIRGENTVDVERYIGALSAGILPPVETTAITRQEALGETLFLGLRMTRGINARRFEEKSGLDIIGAAGGLIGDGLMEAAGGRLRLSERGLSLFNPVVLRLFESLGL